jgi:3'-phosphoadenosine 5'-phosphosulfate (PAPS) 3'-phosphatase
VRAARRAATAILERRGRAEVWTKPDGSPVSSADLAADAAIRATLAEAFPGDPLLSEEGSDDGARLRSRRCWIVDPLDGTRYFLAGSDDFDTFVALVEDGVPVVGVALQPATGLLLGAVAGRGAFVEEPRGPRRPLRAAAATPPRLATKGGLGAPASLAALAGVAAAVGGRLVQAEFSLCPRCFGPGPPAVDAIIGLPVAPPLAAWEWDLAPGDLILREAGGAVTDLDGAPLRYNRPRPALEDGLVLAAGPDLHRALIAALARARTGSGRRP